MRNDFIHRAGVWLVVAALIALAPAGAQAATYTIDGTHSSVLFKIKHYGVSNFYGAFSSVEGSLNYDAASPAAMGIDITIDAASVTTRSERRDDHIKSPDFLNAAEFPTITFKSTSVSVNEDGTLSLTGNLTLHGVTKEIQATAEKIGEGESPRSGKGLVGFEARFSIDRTTFDMGFMAGPLSTDMDFIVSLEASL